MLVITGKEGKRDVGHAVGRVNPATECLLTRILLFEMRYPVPVLLTFFLKSTVGRKLSTCREQNNCIRSSEEVFPIHSG